MAGLVVIFDFDKTIIDCDSDNWVVEELGINNLFTQLLDPYLALELSYGIQDRMMTELHNRGKTIEDIEECLKKVPLHPSIASSIESAHAFGCDLRVVSDANVFFIETILKHHGILHCFSEINTNPSLIDEQGRLRILPYHDFNTSSHGCNSARFALPTCARYRTREISGLLFVQGLMMEKIQASVSADGKKQLVYVGDGAPDFCAGLKLEEGDVLMPRKDFPMCDLISANPLLTKAKIHEWSDWEELGADLLSTVNSSFIQDESSNVKTDQLVPVDCKYQNGSISTTAHEALQNILPVSPPH